MTEFSTSRLSDGIPGLEGGSEARAGGSRFRSCFLALALGGVLMIQVPESYSLGLQGGGEEELGGSEGASQEESALEDARWEETYGDETSIPSKALSCNVSGGFCTGLYEELIKYEQHFPDGLVYLTVTDGVKAALDATGSPCTLLSGTTTVVPASDPRAKEVVDRMQIQRVLGSSILIFFKQGTSNSCEIKSMRFFP